jgi:hypothetical protein
LQDVGADSTKNGHALQKFNPRFNAGVGVAKWRSTAGR